MSLEEQKELKQEQRRLHTHSTNLQRMDGQDPADRARLLEITTESELQSPTEAMQNLNAKDFPLANYDEEADSWEFKGMAEILDLLDEVRFPHKDSVLQGAVREWAYDDPNASLEAKNPNEYIVGESFKLGTYSRATRGEEGFQQETSAKQTRESISVDEGVSGSRGGLRSKIPGL